MNLCKYFELGKEKAFESNYDACTHRNFCVLLGCIAEKMAGPSAIALLTPQTLEYLFYQLVSKSISNISLLSNNYFYQREDAPPCVILFAIIALEKFAQTSENKVKINQELGNMLSNTLRNLELWDDSPNPYKSQVGFCSQWCLDNLCE